MSKLTNIFMLIMVAVFCSTVFSIEAMSVATKPIVRANLNTKVAQEGTRTGTVKYFSDYKGYGFIKDDTIDKELYFHARELKETSKFAVKPNVRVSYDVKEDKKAPIAVNVRLISQ